MARRMRKRGDDSVEVRFNPAFYGKGSVEEAAQDFSGICRIDVSDAGKDILVVIRQGEEKDIEKVGLEFSNYVLGLMKNRGEV